MQPEAFLEHWTRLNTKDYFPGFAPGIVPVMVFDGARTFLFGAADVPAGFTARGDWFEHPGRFDAVTANTDLNGMALVMNGDPLEAAIIATHEAFHVFHGAHFPHWGANELSALTYPVTDAVALHLRRLETIALHRAVTDTDAGWAHTALEYRRERFARIGSDAARFEQDLERFEGLAFYVELDARGLPHRLPLEDFPTEAVRFRAYATGQVLARLLETWRPDFAAEVEHAYLDDSLRATLETMGVDARTLEPDLVQRELERTQTETAALEADRERARAEFRSSGAPLLVLESAASLQPQGFDPMNLRVLGVDELLHSRFLRLGNTNGHVQTLGVPALTQGSIFALRYLEIALQAAPDVLEDGNTLELRGEGFELRFQGASLESDATRWRVRVESSRG
jgi:hypothetical protein